MKKNILKKLIVCLMVTVPFSLVQAEEGDQNPSFSGDQNPFSSGGKSYEDGERGGEATVSSKKGKGDAYTPPKKVHGDYRDYPDFAALEYNNPITPDEVAKLTPKDLDNEKQWPQERLDQLYARSKSGPIPTQGYFRGNIILRDGHGLKGVIGHALNVKGKSKRLGKRLAKLVELVAEGLWVGKRFESVPYGNQTAYFLRNAILRTPLNRGGLEKLLSESNMQMLLDCENRGGAVRANLDVSSIKALRSLPSQIYTQSTCGATTNAWMLFPAKVYCGQSLFDSRRESIIIDYSYGSDIDLIQGGSTYKEGIDSLAGKHGIQFRDEIREVRPGLYLGRGYVQGIFLLYFTLLDKDYGKSRDLSDKNQVGYSDKKCWQGTQQVAEN